MCTKLFSFTLLLTCLCSRPFGQGASVDFNGDTVRATVIEVAATISREYMDAAVAERVADALRKRLTEGQYLSITTPEALAVRLTHDLLVESQDKHLAVAVVPASSSTTPAAPAANTREQGVRRTNAGVQRVEILAGNVGYLNLTAFWRAEEAQEIIGDAMRLLRRAVALIIDLRQNSGGSPETVALTAAYLFDQAGLSLFQIVPRSGPPVAYATPTPAPGERDGRRAVYVLTSARTFSAGEGFAFLLQERARAQVVGERTAGAANPGRAYRVNPWFEVTVPNGQVRSAVSGGNWEGRGVKPDLEVAAADALLVAHSRALKRLIEGADGDWRVRLEQILQSLNAPAPR
jgi:C-terminal processing protease CtpA/Prc